MGQVRHYAIEIYALRAGWADWSNFTRLLDLPGGRYHGRYRTQKYQNLKAKFMQPILDGAWPPAAVCVLVADEQVRTYKRTYFP